VVEVCKLFNEINYNKKNWIVMFFKKPTDINGYIEEPWLISIGFFKDLHVEIDVISRMKHCSIKIKSILIPVNCINSTLMHEIPRFIKRLTNSI